MGRKKCLIIGEFPLKTNAIIDGDTVKVEGLKTTLRLLAIDTEETFKKEKERRLYEAGWSTYLAKVKGKSRKPVKAATPLGMEAKEWAEKFFKGTAAVRLERDHPKEIRGRYNRYLAYVFAKKDGQWINYDNEMMHFALKRHATGTNVLFMDWSVRPVGLKELWTFKWSRQYNTVNPWTKAGGVRPEDWTNYGNGWMAKFKDY